MVSHMRLTTPSSTSGITFRKNKTVFRTSCRYDFGFSVGLISFFIAPEWTNGCAMMSSPKYSGAATAKSLIDNGWIDPV